MPRVAMLSETKAIFVTDGYNPEQTEAIRSVPTHRKWDKVARRWEFKYTFRAIEHLISMCPDLELSEGANKRYTEDTAERELARKAQADAVESADPGDFPFRLQPFEHQMQFFLQSRDIQDYALFAEQGTGKTKMIIDTAAYQYLKGNIDCLLVLAPDCVKINWVEDELEKHMPEEVPVETCYWASSARKAEKERMAAVASPKRDKDKLLVVSINLEALSRKQGRAEAWVKQVMRNRRCMVVVDESTRCKNYSKNRSAAARRIMNRGVMRRILSGTPVTRNPMDLYGQYALLGNHILGFSSFYAFRNRYAVMGGFENKEVIAFKNLDELNEARAPYTFRVLKEQCLDLPPKLYSKRTFTLSPKQRKAYAQMVDKFKVELEDETVAEASIVLTQMMMLQQITSGFVGSRKDGFVDLEDTNPRHLLLLDILEDIPGKVIIWSRFTHELEAINNLLRDKYGSSATALFYGEVPDKQRLEIRRRFQDQEDPLRFFVANPAAGGIGITLNAAETVIYCSNDFDLERRLQSEDRAHRIGTRNAVNYIDIVAQDTVDEHIRSALILKKDIADYVLQDGRRPWLT